MAFFFSPVFVGRARVRRSVATRSRPVSLVKVNGEACPGFQRNGVKAAWDCPGSFAWDVGLSSFHAFIITDFFFSVSTIVFVLVLLQQFCS